MSEILKTFLKNRAAIKRVLARFSLSDADVDDLVQETFIKGFAAETKGRIDDPRAFLFRIARNLAISQKRARKRSVEDPLEDLSPDGVIHDERQADSEECLDSRRKIMLFAEAVAHLPPQCRKAFLMRRVDGLAFKQIAVRMNISVSSAEKHVKSGLLKCAAYLMERGYEPAEFGQRELDAAKLKLKEDGDAQAPPNPR